jgi:hypothetical protein
LHARKKVCEYLTAEGLARLAEWVVSDAELHPHDLRDVVL